MLPRWHILLGVLFGLFLWLVWPKMPLYGAIIAFLASVLIDFDHYLVGVWVTGKWHLSEIFEYYKKRGLMCKRERVMGIRRKDHLQIFHTVEFHLLVLVLGIWVWQPFIYVFAGIMFHSTSDFIELIRQNWIYGREYFLIDALIKNIHGK